MGAAFALSSVLTPFFMGTVVGAIAAGNVPADGNGDAFSSWIQPLPLLTGALFVLAGAYLAAVFLVADSARAGDREMEGWFAGRALAAGVAAGAVALLGLIALHGEARYIYDRLVVEGLPLVIVSILCGFGVLGLLLARRRRGLRPLAAGAVVAVIWGWGVAQFPYLLPTSLRIDQAAAPSATLDSVLVVFADRRRRRPARPRPALLAQPARTAGRVSGRLPARCPLRHRRDPARNRRGRGRRLAARLRGAARGRGRHRRAHRRRDDRPGDRQDRLPRGDRAGGERRGAGEGDRLLPEAPARRGRRVRRLPGDAGDRGAAAGADRAGRAARPGHRQRRGRRPHQARPRPPQPLLLLRRLWLRLRRPHRGHRGRPAPRRARLRRHPR